ncbi:MAG: hypothetical protein JWP35_4648 [Caulobacter sp.]|nr:hypothetical protein [Caulobacter sp.]
MGPMPPLWSANAARAALLDAIAKASPDALRVAMEPARAALMTTLKGDAALAEKALRAALPRMGAPALTMVADNTPTPPSAA